MLVIGGFLEQQNYDNALWGNKFKDLRYQTENLLSGQVFFGNKANSCQKK